MHSKRGREGREGRRRWREKEIRTGSTCDAGFLTLCFRHFEVLFRLCTKFSHYSALSFFLYSPSLSLSPCPSFFYYLWQLDRCTDTWEIRRELKTFRCQKLSSIFSFYFFGQLVAKTITKTRVARQDECTKARGNTRQGRAGKPNKFCKNFRQNISLAINLQHKHRQAAKKSLIRTVASATQTTAYTMGSPPPLSSFTLLLFNWLPSFRFHTDSRCVCLSLCPSVCLPVSCCRWQPPTETSSPWRRRRRRRLRRRHHRRFLCYCCWAQNWKVFSSIVVVVVATAVLLPCVLCVQLVEHNNCVM